MGVKITQCSFKLHERRKNNNNKTFPGLNHFALSFCRYFWTTQKPVQDLCLERTSLKTYLLSRLVMILGMKCMDGFISTTECCSLLAGSAYSGVLQQCNVRALLLGGDAVGHHKGKSDSVQFCIDSTRETFRICTSYGSIILCQDFLGNAVNDGNLLYRDSQCGREHFRWPGNILFHVIIHSQKSFHRGSPLSKGTNMYTLGNNMQC